MCLYWWLKYISWLKYLPISWWTKPKIYIIYFWKPCILCLTGRQPSFPFFTMTALIVWIIVCRRNIQTWIKRFLESSLNALWILLILSLIPAPRATSKLAQVFGVPAVGVWAVDCWQWRSGHFFHPSFPFLFFPLFFFPPSQPFLIEGVLGSKNLFSESWRERPKT